MVLDQRTVSAGMAAATGKQGSVVITAVPPDTATGKPQRTTEDEFTDFKKYLGEVTEKMKRTIPVYSIAINLFIRVVWPRIISRT